MATRRSRFEPQEVAPSKESAPTSKIDARERLVAAGFSAGWLDFHLDVLADCNRVGLDLATADQAKVDRICTNLGKNQPAVLHSIAVLHKLELV